MQQSPVNLTVSTITSVVTAVLFFVTLGAFILTDQVRSYTLLDAIPAIAACGAALFCGLALTEREKSSVLSIFLCVLSLAVYFLTLNTRLALEVLLRIIY